MKKRPKRRKKRSQTHKMNGLSNLVSNSFLPFFRASTVHFSAPQPFLSIFFSQASYWFLFIARYQTKWTDTAFFNVMPPSKLRRSLSIYRYARHGAILQQNSLFKWTFLRTLSSANKAYPKRCAILSGLLFTPDIFWCEWSFFNYSQFSNKQQKNASSNM